MTTKIDKKTTKKGIKNYHKKRRQQIGDKKYNKKGYKRRELNREVKIQTHKNPF